MKKRSGRSKSSKFKLVNFALLGLYSITLCLFLVTMYRYNILDFRYLNYIVTLLLVGVAVLAGLLMWRKKARIFTALLLVFFTGHHVCWDLWNARSCKIFNTTKFKFDIFRI